MRICLTLHCEKLYGHLGDCARWDKETQTYISVPKARVELISDEAQAASDEHSTYNEQKRLKAEWDAVHNPDGILHPGEEKHESGAWFSDLPRSLWTADMERAAEAVADVKDTEIQKFQALEEILAEDTKLYARAKERLAASRRAYALQADKVGAPEGPALLKIWS